jgi:uncharacterized protein (TIGR02145 family)
MKTSILLLIELLLILSLSCKKEVNINLPLLSNDSIIYISETLATIICEVSSIGGLKITKRGVCWSQNQYPTIDDDKKFEWAGVGQYKGVMTKLTAETNYYARSYATCDAGTAYGNQKSFSTTGRLSDIEGNDYGTVKIGNQLWMKENLKTTKYNDGTPIPLVAGNAVWENLSTPAYCWYNNEISNRNTYGALYNWYVVNTEKVCPTGWHVPSNEDWRILTEYIGGETEGDKLKEIANSLWTNSIHSNNETDFTAVPGGMRDNVGGFDNLGGVGVWWSNDEDLYGSAWCKVLGSQTNNISQTTFNYVDGFSIRCLKD